MFEFTHPWILFLLAVVILMVWWYIRWGQYREGTIQFSSLDLLKRVKNLSGRWKIKVLFTLRMIIISLLVMAMARPRAVIDLSETSVNVVDIMLILDISSSMLAEDFKPNRLKAAKKTAEDFINDREGDRLGLLVFAGESYIQCPLTIDYEVLQNLLKQVIVIDKEHDGTAIGMAIAHGVNRLRDSDTESKVIILLSDGSNNAGELNPLTSSGFAQECGIKIYTIGIGTKGKALYPVDDPILGKRHVQVEVDIDEETLRQVAERTNGKYFRATDEESLVEVYEQIDQLERSEIQVKEYLEYRELFAWCLIPALFLAFSERIISEGIFRRKM